MHKGSIILIKEYFDKSKLRKVPMYFLRNPGRDISFPIFMRKEIETRKLERKSKQQISRLNDLSYRLNDIISFLIDMK